MPNTNAELRLDNDFLRKENARLREEIAALERTRWGAMVDTLERVGPAICADLSPEELEQAAKVLLITDDTRAEVLHKLAQQVKGEASQ